MRLTEAQREALRSFGGGASKSWRHPSWIPDGIWELVDAGLASIDVADEGPASAILTKSGREALKETK